MFSWKYDILIKLIKKYYVLIQFNENKNFKLISLTENRIINKKISGIKPTTNNIEAFKKTNVIIDFTVPKCTIEILKIA